MDLPNSVILAEDNFHSQYEWNPCYGGPCQHGMARPQVADGGTASNMEGSCAYNEYVVADSRQSFSLGVGRGADNSSS